VIPACDGDYATLPPGTHQASLDEIYQSFVVEAPFRPRRELIHQAIVLYTSLVKSAFSDARIWIDGGFVTHKPWAEPEDADIVVVVPLEEYVAKANDPRWFPLWTFLNATSSEPPRWTEKLHPMGGLLDTFLVPDVEAVLGIWDQRWSSVNGPDGNLVPGVTKGYLEVNL
jgi:hypothetical protein